jgi:hypothetical protein
MENKPNSPFRKINFDQYKPVGWSMPSTLLMYAFTGGFGLSALLANRFATKYSVENDKARFNKLKSADPEFWYLVKTLENQIKELEIFQKQLELLGEDYIGTRKGNVDIRNQNFDDTETIYHSTLRSSRENFGRGQGVMSLKLIEIQNTCNQFVSKLQQLPTEIQELFDPVIIKEISKLAQINEGEMLKKQVTKLREQFPALIVIGKKDKVDKGQTRTVGTLTPNKLKMQPLEMLIPNNKSSSITLAAVAISTLVAYNPLFTSFSIPSPLPLQALDL